MFRGFRYVLKPTPAQAETLGQWLGVTRLVYNLALEQRRDFHRQYLAAEGKHISLFSQINELTALRAEYEWIAAVPRFGQEAALKDLDLAFQSYFKGGGYPVPRRLGVHDTIRLRNPEIRLRQLNAKWAEVRLPKLGWVRFRQTRPIAGEKVFVTITHRADLWFVSVTCDIGAAPQALNALPAVGVDRGVANTLSLSTGEHISLPDIRALEKRRRRAQRILARRTRGSRRHTAQRMASALLAAKAARVRSHALHEISTEIARRFGVVVLENLKVRAMTASARGTADAPGRNVRQKAGLNRSILAQGWTTFAEQIQYKLEAAGGRLVFVPAPYTSQTCAECGVVDARSRKNQAAFECVACGHSDHADTNAARNILRGSTAFVEGGHLGSPDEARTLAA